MLNVLPSIRLWRTRIICRLPIYRRSRKCRQYRPRAPSRRDNLTICALSLSKSRWRASARGWLSTQRSASAVHGIVAMSHRRRPKLPIVWGGASAAFGLAPEPVPRQNGAAWGAVVAVAGTGAVSEHHMTTTSQRPSMPARHSFQTGQHGSAVTSFFFVFLNLPCSSVFPSISKRNRAARRPAFLMRDRGRGMFAVRCPRVACSGCSSTVLAEVRRSHSGSSVGEWVGCSGLPHRPCDPIAGARRRPHRRSRGGPERQSQSARGGLLVMHTFFLPRRPGDPSIVGDGVVELRDIHSVHGNGGVVAGWRFASGSWRLERMKSRPGMAVNGQWNGQARGRSRNRTASVTVRGP